MKFKQAAVGAVLALSGLVANAGGSLGVLTEDGESFSSVVSQAGITFDTFSFSLTMLSDVWGGAFKSPRVLGLGVELAQGATVLGADGDVTDGFSFAGLTAGMYTLKFAAFSTGKGSYGGNIAATPVPEPETYAMMLAGLVAVGFLARRRQG